MTVIIHYNLSCCLKENVKSEGYLDFLTLAAASELPTPSLSYRVGLESDWGMPQLRLASQFWSYFPSTNRDGCSIRL
jgi:hypothetical protein